MTLPADNYLSNLELEKIEELTDKEQNAVGRLIFAFRASKDSHRAARIVSYTLECMLRDIRANGDLKGLKG